MNNNLPRSLFRDREILIVDDDKVIILLQEKILGKLKVKYPVSSFENGRKALEYLVKHQGSGKKFLIFLDINMPVMNGWEFLAQCQKVIDSELYCTVLVTSSINSSDRKKASEFSRVFAFVEKPLTAAKAVTLKNLEEVIPFFE